MDLRVLEYFLAAAQEGNITNAAASLHVSQPTVSRQLKELEEELGKTLFERTNRNVRLTEDGVLFKETAENILMLYDRAHQKSDASILEGELYIGAAEVEMFTYIAERIRRFQQKHPKVLFHIWSDNADRIRDAVQMGILDVGFILHSVDTLSFETIELPLKSEWGILVREDHPLAVKQKVSVEDLSGESLIIPENRAFRNLIRSWGIEDSPVSSYYTLVKNAMLMTQCGVGITICLHMDHHPAPGLVYVPITPFKETSAMLMWKKKPVQSILLNAFLQEFVI